MSSTITTPAILLAASAIFSLVVARRKAAQRLIKDHSRVGTLVEDIPTTPGLPEDHGAYDVIIIGGGTAGCVLANRLTEDPSVKVLVLEAGGSGKAALFSRIPVAIYHLFMSVHDWKLFTTPQAHAGGLRKYWPRGKMLGGSSSMNAMMFHYGCPSDYDEWPSPWKYKDFHPYFRKFEKYIPHRLFPNVEVSLRGLTGLVQVGYHSYFSSITSKFLDACAAIGIHRNPDVNTFKGTLGSTKVLTYIDGRGHRVSAETSYLTPEVLRRPNLSVAIHAQVTRIVFDGTEEPRASGVEFASSSTGPQFIARARREVVLSAGAVHSPQILMLSGVGPATHLTEHNVPVVANLPGVGSHLLDHVCVTTRFRDTSGASLNYLLPKTLLDFIRFAFSTLRWFTFGTGPLTSNAAEAVAFVRSDDPKLFPPEEFQSAITEDATSGPNCPDIELLVMAVGVTLDRAIQPVGGLFSLMATLLKPTSTGTISLQSNNPFDPPAIDPRYLSTQHDIDVMLRAVRLILRLRHTEPLKSIVGVTESLAVLDHNLDEKPDEELVEIIRTRAQTLYHPTSTARMASIDEGKEKSGVVDSELRVYGVKALRVVDASVFPTIIAGHTAAPCFALAEKAAELIKVDL